MVLIRSLSSKPSDHLAPMSSEEASSQNASQEVLDPARPCNQKDTLPEDGEQLNVFAHRYAEGSIPVVYPSEQEAMSEEEAKKVLAFVQKLDTVKVISFIDDRYRQFCEDSSGNEEIPDTKRRAIYNKDKYYIILRELVSAESKNTVLLSSITNEFGLDRLGEARKEEVRRILSDIDPTKQEEFLTYVRLEVSRYWESKPLYWRKAKDEIVVKQRYFGRQVEDLLAGWKRKLSMDEQTVSQASSGLVTLRKALSGWVDITSLGPEECNKIADMIDIHRNVDAATLKEYMENSWMKEWALFSDEEDMSEEETKRLWFAEKGAETLAALLDVPVTDTQGFVFKPEIDLKSLSASAAEALQEHIPFISEEQSERIRVLTKQRFYETYKEIHPKVIEANYSKMYVSFLDSNYLSIILEVLGSSRMVEEPYSFQPAITVEELQKFDGNEDAEDLFASVKREHEAAIRERTDKEFNKMLLILNAQGVTECKEKLYSDLLSSTYLDIIRGVLSDSVSTVEKGKVNLTEKTSGTRRRLTSPPPPLNEEQFCSPRKQPRVERSQSVASEGGPSEIVSVAALYGKIGAEAGSLFIEARFLYCDSETRVVSDSKAKIKSKKKGPVAVLTLVLADRTGYICLELWRDVATSVCEIAQEWLADEGAVYLRISNFAVVEDRRKFLSKNCKLTGDDRTLVERIPSSSQPSLMDSTTHLAGNLFIRNLSFLAVKPPFVVHLAGVVSLSQGMKLSRGGEEMLDFRFIDTSGNYVDCRAFGRHARNQLIADKNELVIYGASVPSSQNSQSEFLWLHNDCHIVLLKRKCTVPKAVCLIEFAEDE